MMDTNGPAPLAAYSKPSDAPSALRFVKDFVKDCEGIEFDVGFSHEIVDRRVQKPAPESLQILGQVLYDFGDLLSSDDIMRVLVILLDLIRYPSPLGSKASLPIQDAGSQIKVVDSETLRLAINALTNLLAQSLSTISKDNWLHMVKTMRDVLETLTNEGELVVDWKYSRIYSGLLRCFQLVLSDFKASIGDHVAGLVASLVSFLGYGWSANHFSMRLQKPDEGFSDAQKKEAPTNKPIYKPPHLRRMSDKTWSQKLENSRDNHQSKSEVERLVLLSDSDQSDSDGATGNQDRFKCSKTRTLAILNIQALARAEPKSLHAHWTLLFPMYDILNTRRVQNSLLKTLLYDPILKVRVAAAATISLMLEGPSRAFIRMAEFRDIGKTGSFMTLSFSLGQVLLQLQRGLSHLAVNETNLGLLVAILKALSLFVGSAPFSRLPNEMLPNIIEALQKRVKCLLSLSTNDQVNAVCMALNCIGFALNTTPSDQVARMLSKEGSETIVESRLLQDLLYCTEAHMPTLVRVEALQALKFTIHNYPCIAVEFWSFITPIKHGILKSSVMPSIGGDPSCEGFHLSDDKVVLATTKLLNESLRAVSGPSFTDDAQDDVFHHSLSASQAMHMLPVVAGQNAQALDTRTKVLEVPCWHESLRDYLPLLLQHPSVLVRAEAMTCFAGLTFSVFCDLAESQRSYIIATVLELSRKDESSVVRSTSCRALGVLVNFPKLTARTEFLTSAMDLILYSTRDSALVVQITASWALANLCDALRYTSEGNNGVSISLSFKALAECAMRLSKDNDKVRANAVRALGNLTRVIKFDSDNTNTITKLAHDINPHDHEHLQLKASEKYSWLERVVQTLVSCVTTGNVKVQWNVCRALGNLFLNKSILLSDMGWSTSVYSILLLLLRDSKNFKIRIQAASALAVPEMRGDYGESFSDVVQALVLALDALNSSEAFDPSTFKYISALSEQLTTTCLHVLELAECGDYELLQDFLIKRESFLESWLRSTLLSASQEVTDGGCQCLENEGTTSSHLARCWIHKERQPRERIWYALNDRDSKISNEKTLHKRMEAVSRVCGKLVELYTYGKHIKRAGPFQQLLNQSR